ncbi:MAG: hypothetical protein KKD44_29110 [Proteobacteria bacterium]|nr:hypothetical protein [Pseudomonadota bacterium]
MAGQYAVAVLGKWYPEFGILDIDDRPRGTVDEIREKLELDEKNSMLFSSESPDSYHVLVKPEYNEKPPTVRLLNGAFRNFCDVHKIEIYPQSARPIRLPFGPVQVPLDLEYSHLGDWKSKLYWFQKLNGFDIREVRGQQLIFDFDIIGKPGLPNLTEDGSSLLQYGLQAPASRHDSQFKVLYFLWRRNVPIEAAEETTFSWIRRKHNGFSKDIIRHPQAVRKEIARQADHIYGKYELSKIYPDSTHNLYNGFISRPDVEDIIRIARGSLPRMRFLFHLVKFCYPRRFRTFVSVHTNRLIEWGSRRTYNKYLQEFEAQGLLKRGSAYQTGLFSKAIKLEWPFKSSSEAVLYDGRSIETFEGTVKTVFKPGEMRGLIENAGRNRQWTYKVIKRIWEDPGR